MLDVAKLPQFSPHEDFIFYPHAPGKKWNSSFKPLILSHDTDFHINIESQKTQDAFSKNLQIADRYKPELHILTGDLSDDYTTLKTPRYSHQVEDDWKLYFNILQTTPYTYDILECAGNHDMWDIKSKDSNHFYLLQYTKTYKRRSDSTQSEKYEFEDVFLVNEDRSKYGGHTILVMNPFRFPTAHSTLLFYPEPQKSFLDKLEDFLYNKNLTNLIVICHYPPDMWRKVKSTKGKKTIRDMMANENIDIIITGHTHPDIPKIRHHGTQTGILEITGVGGPEHEMIGLVTEDNNRFVYHAVDTNNPPLGFVTHPVPLNQTNFHTAFAEENTEIRVLFPSDNASIKVIGDCQCEKMSLTLKVNNYFYLYSCPLVLNTIKKSYHIDFEGDFVHSLDFVYGNTTYAVKGETERNSPHNCYVVIYFGAGLFVLFQIMLFPFPTSFLNFTEIEEWIEDLLVEKISVLKHILYSLFCLFFGFLSIRARILSTPLYVRLSLYIAATWPIALPTSFMLVDNVLGFIFSYGYVCHGYVYTTDGPTYTFLYLYYLIIPFIILMSALAVKKKLYWTIFVDVIASLLLICYGVDQTIVERLIDSIGFKMIYASFCFMWIPFALLVVICIWAYSMFKHRNDVSMPVFLKPLLTSDY